MPLRIALIANSLPAPADSGSMIRACRLAHALAGVGAVSLYARCSESDAERHGAHPDLAPFDRIRLDPEPDPVHASLSRVFSGPSMDRWMADDDPLGAILARDHAEAAFDVVVCQQLFTANVARGLPGVPMVLDEHNVESQAIGQVLGAYERARVPIDPALATARIEAYERAAWPRAALITCPTVADADRMRGHTTAAVRVVPNGADTDLIPMRSPSRRAGKSILFVGAYFWPPNFKAAQFLARRVLPLVRAREPQARLVLCGKSPGIEVALLRKEGVEITGTVPSTRPYLDDAMVYGNALFQGAGSSLKVLEALASGIPLVSTPAGVRGHPVEPGRHYIPAEDAEGFAGAILGVLADPAAFDAQAAAGRAVAESLSWPVVGADFASAVARVARGERLKDG
ncbi:glycosyltransferase [Aquisphaera insulae]|uniref:glycosyltransferase n=1 Tax=Aquisphaera insulae TaxID=2712864 RepID=UPI0013EC764E|nr:glycosyltransferase [Aquisphaera insulae]